MKSVISEANTIAKAIELAWQKAGCPNDFTVKVFQEPQRNLFGITKMSAKVGIFFDDQSITQKIKPLIAAATADQTKTDHVLAQNGVEAKTQRQPREPRRHHNPRNNGPKNPQTQKPTPQPTTPTEPLLKQLTDNKVTNLTTSVEKPIENLAVETSTNNMAPENIANPSEGQARRRRRRRFRRPNKPKDQSNTPAETNSASIGGSGDDSTNQS